MKDKCQKNSMSYNPGNMKNIQFFEDLKSIHANKKRIQQKMSILHNFESMIYMYFYFCQEIGHQSIYCILIDYSKNYIYHILGDMLSRYLCQLSKIHIYKECIHHYHHYQNSLSSLKLSISNTFYHLNNNLQHKMNSYLESHMLDKNLDT